MSKVSLAWLVSALVSFFYPDIRTASEQAPLSDTIRRQPAWAPPAIPPGDTAKVKDNPNDRRGDPTHQPYVTPLFLRNPANLTSVFEIDDSLKGYTIYERVGKVDFRRPSYIPFEDYLEYRREKGISDYFRQQSLASNAETRKGLELSIDAAELSDIFGGGSITIRPTGYATINLSVDHNRIDNPALPLRQQRTTQFNFDQQIQLGVIGQIGEKLKLNANFDTQATFEFENQFKIDHAGTEDQILQKIEAGNVSMQLGNSLIQGRQNLFGIKTRLRFGPVYVTAIASTERGKVESMQVSGGGAIETPFEKEVAEYDMNRHFFLSHFFRSRYEAALANLPAVQSTLRINRVEVWVEQQGATRNNRNAVGFVDLGENDNPVAGGQGRINNPALDRNPATYTRYPDNQSNNLYDLVKGNPAAREQSSAKSAIEGLGLNLQNTSDFQVLGNMRRLEPNEYTVNTQLGFVSLNSPIPPDQVLFIAFNYTLNGQTYQVGEFSDDVPANGLNSNVVFLKMLKPSVVLIAPYPAWDLMMKNVYNIGYGIQPENFFLDLKYESGTSAGKINFLPRGAVANRPLIQVTGLDRLTNHTAPGPDNYFDFVPGITIVPDRGLIIFPVLEPFGDWLAQRLDNNPDDVAQYVFSPLYDRTQQDAIQLFPELNRYSIEGRYRSSSSSEIPLNTFNLSEGSVTLTAGGRQLTEGVDYQVDYSGGKVIILNQGLLTSGQPIQVSYESSSLFNVQTKTLLGTRVEYSPTRDLQLGATLLNLREQPFNQKTILGDEAVNNTLWGLDGSFRRQSDFLTKVIDRLPLLSTKETSSINVAGEFAQFVPGAPPVTRIGGDRGVVFLDDFEAAATPYLLSGQRAWRMASFPEGNPRLFDPRQAFSSQTRAEGYTRAKLAWYSIDQSFYLGGAGNINFPEPDKFNNYTRQVRPYELFPTASRPFGTDLQVTFDLHYQPALRGLYNYQDNAGQLDPATGRFRFPEQNWAGIMREIDFNNDFEASNIEFLEFWMMDPFMDNPNHEGGEFYVNLGLLNEDVLPDEALSRENGLPGINDPVNLTDTDWGRVALGNPPVTTFSNDREDRVRQDVGFDGLPSADEAVFFEETVNELSAVLGPQPLAEFAADPSSDDYLHFRDASYEQRAAGILERYLKFNGPEGNSPVGENNQNFTTQANNEPDTEDLNRNGSLNFAEQYWEYRIRLHPDSMERGQNFIVDKITNDSIRAQTGFQSVTWYQFRIPLNAGRSVNNIPNFKTISFMRMYLTGFEEPVILRMTEFQMVASQWRKFSGSMAEPNVIINPQEPPFADFQLGNVSIEENSRKQPFNYLLPPDVVRQQLNGNTAVGFLDDERSLQLRICGLQDGDGRAIFKNTRHDLRLYESLRMWVHAEAIEDGTTPSNFTQRNDAKLFIRLGLDNDFNYYEYELPLTPSDPAGGPSSVSNIWLADNEINFELVKLALAKADRNSRGTGLIYRHAYTDSLPEGHVIYVKGTPKLSDIRNIVIGVRNPSDPGGQPICLEVWVNELRLTNFDQTKGWAANANASIKLADLGTVNATASYRSAGFGPLDQKLSGRPQEDAFRYDVSANLSLDRFFPRKWGLQLPVYAAYGEQRINPQFNPQEADVRTDQLIEALDPAARRLKLQEIQDFRRNRSISLNNWQIRPVKEQPAGAAGQEGKGKPPVAAPWSITNFDFTFAFNEQFARSATIQRLYNTQYRGAVNYRYTFPQISLQPFKNVKKIKMLSGINLSPLPTAFSMSVLGDRQFEERLMRPTSQFGGQTDPFFAKNFLINRNYNLSWNLMRSLQLTYSASNIARVDEVKGYWETASQQERDSVGSLMENFLRIGRDPANGHDQLINFGRTTQFNQTFNVAYQLPFAQIKPLNWISGTITYTGAFNWQQAPENRPEWGATIGNQQSLQANGRLDLNSLYRKVKPLKKILEQQPGSAQKPQAQQPPKPGAPPVKPPEASAKTDTAKKPDPFRVLKLAGREVIRIALSVRSIDLTYSQNANTILPGYLPKTDNFGLDFRYQNPVTGERSPLLPPTLGFVMGSQADIRSLAGQNGWITTDTTLASLYSRNSTNNLQGRTSVELFRGFRIELNANRSLSFNGSEFFRYDAASDTFRAFDPLNNGNFNMSYIFANTSFEFGDPKSSENFERFSDIRQQISARYAEKNPQTAGNSLDIVEGGYRNGYLGTNQEVLITSVLAAYGAVGADRVELTPFPRIPLPNWSVNYNGLTSLPVLKKYFTSVTLRHTYRGTYSVGTFNNNLNARDLDGDGIPDNYAVTTLDPITGQEIRNYYAIENIQGVQITEQFAPLLGLNLNFKNGLTSQIDYKRGRQFLLNVGGLQLTETRNEDVAVMVGYRKDKMNLNFRFFGRDISMKNSMNFQFQATLRDLREANHSLSQTGSTTDPTLGTLTTRGALNVIVRPSVDYVVNTRINVKVFFEHNMNRPHTAQAYNTSFTSGGVQLRFSLAQ